MKKLNLKNQMNIDKLVVALFLVGILFTSCEKNDDNDCDGTCAPSATEFNSVREMALENITQSFQVNVVSGTTTIISAKGVEIDINPSCLNLNGNPLTTGTIAIEFAEVFDGGTMLVTDKTTMGQLPNGDMAMLKSGGEFYLNATLNGQQLDLSCPMNLRVPANLTAPETGMTLWTGTVDENGNLDWVEQPNIPAATGLPGGVILDQNSTGGQTYYTVFNDFGWTNVDKFMSYPDPKTQILAGVPSGYNSENSAVYLHYDGEGNALAKLDTYDASTGLFSEHYGQVPVGLACHIIFATEENGQWKYAIKPVNIAANAQYNFTLAETTVGTEAQLIAAINALP